jgi:hypothetical protein
VITSFIAFLNEGVTLLLHVDDKNVDDNARKLTLKSLLTLYVNRKRKLTMKKMILPLISARKGQYISNQYRLMYWKQYIITQRINYLFKWNLFSLFGSAKVLKFQLCPQFVFVLAKGSSSKRSLTPEDFVPLIQDIVDTHPGLGFLKEATEFHSRYVHTVSSTLFKS